MLNHFGEYASELKDYSRTSKSSVQRTIFFNPVIIVKYMKTNLESNEGLRDWQNLFAVTSGGSRGGARGPAPPPSPLLYC